MLPWLSIAPLLRPVVPLVYRMAARSSSRRSATACRSLWRAARSSRLPLRSSSSVKTCAVPAVNAMRLTHEKLLLVHTTTLGCASPMKYSISALWYAVFSGR